MRMNSIAGLLVLALLAIPGTITRGQAEAKPAEDAGDAKKIDPIAEAIKQVNEQDNGVTINADGRYIDVSATVCLRRGEFLEMFACTKDTREHESILVVDAAPSTMHLGLLLLGLEPGKPLSYDRKFDPPKLVPAKGPEVAVFIVVKADDVEREIPANRWVQDNKTKEMKKGNTWLFAGSQFAEFQDKQVYQADLNGSAISLVNFGDDLLTLPNKLTDANDSHSKVWAPRTDAIPKVGTNVVIRLKPTPTEQDKAKDAKNPPPLPVPADEAKQ
ncbi:MAG: hypothetical protein KTR15_00860 [Phycisphaeraceae bacterium]|nr:hypothetical protein [Phycisphaeraceae bacterium]